MLGGMGQKFNVMKKATLLFFFLSLIKFSYSQTINQLDASGKKDGKWIVYLDKNWKHINDSTAATYFRYTFYDHGTNLYPMGPCGGKNYKIEITSNNSQSNEKIKLLDGEYKWLDAKGQISSIHIFKNGEYISCKEFYSSGKLKHYFDYMKKWEEQPHTWCVYEYDKKGNIKFESYMRKDKNGRWPSTRG